MDPNGIVQPDHGQAPIAHLVLELHNVRQLRTAGTSAEGEEDEEDHAAPKGRERDLPAPQISEREGRGFGTGGQRHPFQFAPRVPGLGGIRPPTHDLFEQVGVACKRFATAVGAWIGAQIESSLGELTALHDALRLL